MTLRSLVTSGCAAATMAMAAACAREGLPPGGPVDRRPPVLVETVPDTFAKVPDFQGPVRFEFNERISEKVSEGTLDDAVLVSPQTGDVHVSHDRHGVSVSLGGGFRSGLTYRITLLPVLSDLFNNKMRDPIELVFSTGGTFDNTAVAGLVWDRLTGNGVPAAQVQMTSDSDSLVYKAQSDSAGLYAFRYLPAGGYHLIAFLDQNRNEKPDASELQGTRTVQVGVADTLILDESILRPDTTPAKLTDISALDSVTVVVQFDDYLDPTTPVSGVTMHLSGEGGSEGPGIEKIFQATGWEAYVDQVRDSFARLDSLKRIAEVERRLQAMQDTTRSATDTVAAARDTARSARDTTVAAAHQLPPRLPGASPAPGGRARGRGPTRSEGPNGEPLPGRRLVARLDRPLEPRAAYVLTVTGVVNINGIPGGGGRDTLIFVPPEGPEPDSSAVDSLATDTLHADTLAIPGGAADTSQAADTLTMLRRTAYPSRAVDTLTAQGRAADTLRPDRR